MEEYKSLDFIGYPNYKVSSDGHVWNIKSGRRLKGRPNNSGYLRVKLGKGSENEYLLHRLVAFAFVPNEWSYWCDEVNHKNEIITDNRKENLEWCDRWYNLHYGTAIERMTDKVSKKVMQFTKSGEFVAEYKSATEASRITGFDRSGICHVCRCEWDTYKDFIWKYK